MVRKSRVLGQNIFWGWPYMTWFIQFLIECDSYLEKTPLNYAYLECDGNSICELNELTVTENIRVPAISGFTRPHTGYSNEMACIPSGFNRLITEDVRNRCHTEYQGDSDVCFLIRPSKNWCWARVCDAGTTLNEHRVWIFGFLVCLTAHPWHSSWRVPPCDGYMSPGLLQASSLSISLYLSQLILCRLLTTPPVLGRVFSNGSNFSASCLDGW